jgi:putative glutamine amidotransferase
MIPTTENRDIIAEYVRRVHGILLPGSPTDIDPKHYGAVAHEKLGKLYPERDATDFAILDLVESQQNMPVLGICFGIQSLNVYRGGSLIQDIPALVDRAVPHDEDDSKPPVRHTVGIAEDSLIGQLASRRELEVNSYHHQAVEKPGRNLRPVAFANDGLIEAVEDTTGRFIVGIQWHPERGWKEDAFSKALFSKFIEQAAVRYNQAL